MGMEYIHPKSYKGVKYNTPHNQSIVKARVEKYCLKCDLFMGQEHDFSECQTFDKWENGKIVKKKTCPFDNVAVSVIQPEIKCKEEKVMDEDNKNLDINYANEACDTMKNCNQCSIVYGCLKDGSLIPCNFIRRKYGVSIWNYKDEYRKGLKNAIKN